MTKEASGSFGARWQWIEGFIIVSSAEEAVVPTAPTEAFDCSQSSRAKFAHNRDVIPKT